MNPFPPPARANLNEKDFNHPFSLRDDGWLAGSGSLLPTKLKLEIYGHDSGWTAAAQTDASVHGLISGRTCPIIDNDFSITAKNEIVSKTIKPPKARTCSDE